MAQQDAGGASPVAEHITEPTYLAYYDDILRSYTPDRLAAARVFFARGRIGASKRDDAVIASAMRLLQQHLHREAMQVTSPATARTFLSLQMSALEHKVFAVIWLHASQRVIAYEPLFSRTLSQSIVYACKVVKRALARNAAAVLLAHNHPSGSCDPSAADNALTSTLQLTLALIDVKVVDHIIVGSSKTMSFS